MNVLHRTNFPGETEALPAITGEMTKIANLAIFSSNRMNSLRRDCTGFAVAEASRRYIEMLQALNEPPLVMQWFNLGYANGQRNFKIACACLETMMRTQDAMAEAWSECFGRLNLGSVRAGDAYFPRLDRRIQAEIIDFPDRRRAA